LGNTATLGPCGPEGPHPTPRSPWCTAAR
jgi:hypothetical protein